MPKIDKASPKTRSVKQFFLLLVVVLIMFVVSMNMLSQHLTPLSSSNSAVSPKQDLEIAIKTDKTVYKRNESMQLQLVVINRTDKNIILEFPSSIQYNFIVKREFDFVAFKYSLDVWQSSYAKPLKANTTTLAIPPRQTKFFKEVWNLTDARGGQVAPGRYVILGILPATGGYKTELQIRTQATK